MGERWFLRVDGIDGESNVERFERWIEADEYSWEVTVPTADTSGRGTARQGRATFGNLVVTAPISVASPPLVAACVTGRRLSAVVLSGIRDAGGAGGGRADVFLSYELDDALLVGVRHRDDPDIRPTERLEFAYRSVRITYTPQDDRGGAAGQPVSTEHDVFTTR